MSVQLKICKSRNSKNSSKTFRQIHPGAAIDFSNFQMCFCSFPTRLNEEIHIVFNHNCGRFVPHGKIRGLDVSLALKRGFYTKKV